MNWGRLTKGCLPLWASPRGQAVHDCLVQSWEFKPVFRCCRILALSGHSLHGGTILRLVATNVWPRLFFSPKYTITLFCLHLLWLGEENGLGIPGATHVPMLCHTKSIVHQGQHSTEVGPKIALLWDPCYWSGLMASDHSNQLLVMLAREESSQL